MSAIVSAARDWFAHGLVPMAVRNKRPLAKGWQNLDPAEHLARIEAEPPEQLGLRMGVQPKFQRRLIAIDVDSPKGGEATMVALLEELGPLPETLTQRTGGGGWHYVLEWPPDLAEQCPTTSTEKLGPGIDIRGEGGHIVVAPSPHASGGRYEIVKKLRPAMLPAAWLRRIVATHRLLPIPAPLASSPPSASLTLVERARRYTATMPPAISYSGGHAATWRVAQVLVRGFALPRAEAERLLREYNRRCAPPWSEHELAHKLDDAAQRSRMPLGWLLEQARDHWHPDAWRAEWEPSADALEPMASGNGPAMPSDVGADTDRPRITLKCPPGQGHRELADVAADAARALGERAPEVFCKDGQLVDVGPIDVYIGRLEKRALTTPGIGIRLLPDSEVQRLLSECASWSTWKYSKPREEWVEVPTDPPRWLAVMVKNMGRWSTVRPLSGVITAPSLRPDGSVIQQPGWDEETRYLYQPTQVFPPVEEAPTRDDSRAALQQLREVFAPPADEFDGFPFASEADGDVPIAALLTILARPAIEGPTPAFLFDATTPGSGKTLLADLVCLITTGREMPKATFPEKGEELEKMLGGLALQGATVVGFDNLDSQTPLRGAALDKVLTSTTPQLRILGKSELPTVTWRAVVIATGNNVPVMGDTIRRCIRSRQEPECERPEERSRFRISDVKAYVREHRPRLVCAALTLLRGYYAAGRPSVGTKPFGSFREWQRVVADALVWAGAANILDCRTDADDGDDPELNAAATLLQGIHRLARPITASELIAEGYDWCTDFRGIPVPGSERHPVIKEALDVLVPRRGRDGRPTPKSVGWALKRIRGRVFRGLKLRSLSSGKGGRGSAWEVVLAANGSPEEHGVSGLSGVSQEPMSERASHEGEEAAE